MDLILPIFTGVLVVALIVYTIFRPRRSPTEEESLPKEAPLPVPPERAALGIQALLRRTRDYHMGRYEQIRGMTFRPPGDLIVARSSHRLVFWSAEDGAVHLRKTYRVRGGDHGAGPLAWSRDGERILLVMHSSGEDVLNLFRFSDATLLGHVTVKGRDMTHVEFAPDDDIIGWTNGDQVGIWDPASGELRSRELTSRCRGIAFVRHDGGRPALMTHDGNQRFVYRDPETFDGFDETELDVDEWFGFLLAEGTHALYTTSRDIRLRELRQGELVATLETESPAITCGWSDRRGRRVALGTDDGRIVLWRPDEERVSADVKVAEAAISKITGSEAGLIAYTANAGEAGAEVLNAAMMENAWRP